MRPYYRSRADYIEYLYLKYRPMEEKEIWCIWIGEEDTDYVLCDWDWDLLPNLYKKDETRYTYNQYKNKWSYVSCTIFAAIWMLSDLINYEFSYEQIKEVDELSYTMGRIRWHWWYVKKAVKLVADRYNESELSKKYGKVAYYRISKYNDEIIENAINNLYTIDWNLGLNSKYNEDKKDWMVDGTEFWTETNWHSIDIVCKEWQRSVKDSGSVEKDNYYWLKNKLSQISNFWPYFYVYTLVKEDNLEEIKRLNEIKSECNTLIEHLWTLYNLVNDTNFQWVLHYTANKLRDKVKTCNEMLAKLI